MAIPRTLAEAVGRGSDAIDVVAALLQSFPRDTLAMLAEIEVPPIAQNRLLTKGTELEPLVASALALRQDHGVPFWMAIMFEAEANSVQLPRELLAAASLHQPMAAAKVEHLPVSVIDGDYLRGRSAIVSRGRILTISSRFTSSDGTSFHVPMLDFRIPSSERTLSTAKAVVNELNVEGWLLDSGRSFHFYGVSRLSDSGLTDFLARSLFFTPIIDYRWIAHQLVEGACALRLSSGSDIQRVPRLVAEVPSRI
jgi:hypothetical protein